MNPKNSNPDFTGERHIFHYTFLFDAYVVKSFPIFLLTIKCMLFIMCILEQRTKGRRDGLFENTHIKYL